MPAKPFLFTANPYDDENLLSYLVRLTELNRYEYPSMTSMAANLCFQHQWHPRLIFFTALNLKQLGEMTEVPEETLQQLAYPDVDGEGMIVKYNGQAFSKHLLGITRPKVCPECLVEAPYARKLWDLSAYTACGKHGVKLIDACPKCKMKLSWSRRCIVKCTCGFDLTKSERISVESSDVAIFKLMHDMFYGINADAGTPLYKLTFAKLISLIDFMAAQTKATRNTKGLFLARQSQSDAHDMVVKAYDVFRDWPNNFYSFLDEYRSIEKTTADYKSRVTGIVKELGPFYKPLRSYKEPEYDFIIDEFETYLETWDGGIVKQGSQRRIERSRYCSMDSVVDELGMSMERLKKFYDLGLLRGKSLDRVYSTVYRIEKESVAELKAHFDSIISIKQASEKLGIAIKLVETMVKQGMLQDAYKGTPLEDEMERAVTAESVNNLMDMIRAKIAVKNENMDFISFAQVIDRIHILKMSYLDCIDEISAGRIVPSKETDGTGLQRFYFDKADIEGYMQQRKRELLGDMLTLQEVKAELQVGKIHAIRIWIKNGLLSGNQARKNGLPWWSISPSEVESFKAKYVLASRVAARYEMVPQKLIKVLGEKGIIPVSGTAIDGSQVYLFLQRDVEEAGYSTEGCWGKNSLISA